MIIRPALLACTSLAFAALVLGACGGSDEDEIRSLTTRLQRLQQSKDAKGVCAVLTPRAEAQATAVARLFSGATGDCAAVLSQTEQSDDRPTAGDVDRAKIEVRGDRAVLTYRAVDDGTIGYRKVGGDWRVDNLLNARLDEPPRRLDPALSRGSDEAQIRATYKAAAIAFSRSDFRRACDLMSYEAEAQLVVGAAFTMFDEPQSGQPARSISCTQAVRRIDKLGGDERPFAGHVPTVADVEAARVSIRGASATMRVPGDEPQQFVRRDGHWLIGPDRESISVSEPPSADALAACWTHAGAVIARTKRDLRFASAAEVRATKLSPGRASVKGADWRIFYTLQDGDVDPGLSAILADPSIVETVAYVKQAPAHAATVKRARKCGSRA